MLPGAAFYGGSGGSGGVAPVNPSIVGNFPAFSNVTGAMQDSGFSGASFPLITPAASARNIIQPTAANIIPLTVKGFASQSANILEVHKSDATVLASVSPAGLGTFVGGVTTAQTVIAGVSDTIQLSVTPNGTQTNPTVKLFTNVVGKEWKYSQTGGIVHQLPDDATAIGERIYTTTRTYTAYSGANMTTGVFAVSVTFTPAGNTTNAQFSAIKGRVTKTGASDGGSATPSYLAGVVGDVTPVTNGSTFRYIGVAGSTQPSGTGSVTHSISVLADVSGSMTSGLTNQYGVVIASTSTLGINSTYTSTPTNLYGLYMENMTRGITLNYSIFTNSGLVHFGDNAEIVGSRDAIQFSVTPNGTQTNPTVKLLTTNGGKDWQYSKTGGVVHSAVDDASSTPELIYSAVRTYTGSIGTSLSGGAVKSDIVYNPGSNATSARAAALFGRIVKNGSFNGGSASPSWLAGVLGEVDVNAGTHFRIIGLAGVVNPTSSIVVTHSISVLASIGGAMNGAATNQYGVVVATGTLGIVSFTGTPTNLYGVYVEDITAGATLNYSIFTNAGLVHFGDNVEMASGKNLVLDTATGTKIGTATNQKLGFWNATPIIQPSGATQAAPAAYATGVFGLDSDANMHALYDLVVAMRTALVNSGIMKGAA